MGNRGWGCGVRRLHSRDSKHIPGCSYSPISLMLSAPYCDYGIGPRLASFSPDKFLFRTFSKYRIEAKARRFDLVGGGLGSLVLLGRLLLG